MNTRLNHIQNWPELAQQTDWSLLALAKKSGVSLRTLERYMLAKLGKCPRAWITELKGKRAIELLRNGSNVNETADRLGYQHARNFAAGAGMCHEDDGKLHLERDLTIVCNGIIGKSI